MTVVFLVGRKQGVEFGEYDILEVGEVGEWDGNDDNCWNVCSDISIECLVNPINANTLCKWYRLYLRVFIFWGSWLVMFSDDSVGIPLGFSLIVVSDVDGCNGGGGGGDCDGSKEE